MTKSHTTLKDIFRRGSKTYFNSSILFPKEIRQDVTILYAFVRVADDFVDSTPQDTHGFLKFRDRSLEVLDKQDETCSKSENNSLVINSFKELYKRKNFSLEWVKAFLGAMEADLNKSVYKNIDETIEYMYGSAEVVGLMMACILDLPKESHESARMLGRAMQFINFIRDIDEDTALNRTYLPEDRLLNAGLKTVRKSEYIKSPEKFTDFIREQIKQYFEWQGLAEEGFHYIPARYRIPIKTASEMYKWTARKIYEDPGLVFKTKVKPSKVRILTKGFEVASKSAFS